MRKPDICVVFSKLTLFYVPARSVLNLSAAGAQSVPFGVFSVPLFGPSFCRLRITCVSAIRAGAAFVNISGVFPFTFFRNGRSILTPISFPRLCQIFLVGVSPLLRALSADTLKPAFLSGVLCKRSRIFFQFTLCAVFHATKIKAWRRP